MTAISRTWCPVRYVGDGAGGEKWCLSPAVRGPWLTGKLSPVGILARLDPRHWGGRRVLQFLTGLALAALSLVAVADMPVASAGPAQAAAASPVEITPAGPATTSAERVDAPAGPVEPQVSEADAQQAATGHSAPVAATVQSAPDVVLHLTAVTGTVGASSAGPTPASLGSRGPPLR